MHAKCSNYLGEELAPIHTSLLLDSLQFFFSSRIHLHTSIYANSQAYTLKIAHIHRNIRSYIHVTYFPEFNKRSQIWRHIFIANRRDSGSNRCFRMQGTCVKCCMPIHHCYHIPSNHPTAHPPTTFHASNEPSTFHPTHPHSIHSSIHPNQPTNHSFVHPPTHTHTHTQRERERERDNQNQPLFTFLGFVVGSQAVAAVV